MFVNAAVYPEFPGKCADAIAKVLKKQLGKDRELAAIRDNCEFISRAERRRRKSARARRRVAK